MINTKEITIIEKDYLNDLNKIKDTIRTNQNKAMVVVNSAMIMTYYEIGRIINERKIWGNKYIERLSTDLKEYGKGYSYDNLNYMRRFSFEFSYHEIFEQPARLIAWFTYVIIMQKSHSHKEMLWYVEQTYKNKWSRSQVESQFKAKAYERYLINPDTSIQNSEVSINTELNEIVKDTYVLDFIGVNDIISEKELQNSILSNIQKFILELGQGFSFVREKYKLPIDDIEYEIDLLFYHIPSHSYVVIELKTTKFKPEYIGQLLFYTNYIDDYVKSDLDSPTIGIVLCSEANSVVCKTTLKNTKNLAISKYKVIEELTEYLERKLNEK